MAKALRIVALGLMVTAAACGGGGGGGGGASQQGTVAPNPPAAEPAPEATTATSALSAGSLVLAADAIGPLSFGTQAARALSGLNQALGKAAPPATVADPIACGATRVFGWNGFSAVVNEVSGRSGGKTGLVGWSLRGQGPAGADLKTAKGIGLGSTVKSLRAAYGDTVVFAPGAAGPGFTITTDRGSMTGDLDSAADGGRVVALRAGTVC